MSHKLKSGQIKGRTLVPHLYRVSRSESWNVSSVASGDRVHGLMPIFRRTAQYAAAPRLLFEDQHQLHLFLETASPRMEPLAQYVRDALALQHQKLVFTDASLREYFAWMTGATVPAETSAQELIIGTHRNLEIVPVRAGKDQLEVGQGYWTWDDHVQFRLRQFVRDHTQFSSLFVPEVFDAAQPEEYEAHIYGSTVEIAGFTVAEQKRLLVQLVRRGKAQPQIHLATSIPALPQRLILNHTRAPGVSLMQLTVRVLEVQLPRLRPAIPPRDWDRLQSAPVQMDVLAAQ